MLAEIKRQRTVALLDRLDNIPHPPEMRMFISLVILYLKNPDLFFQEMNSAKDKKDYEDVIEVVKDVLEREGREQVVRTFKDNGVSIVPVIQDISKFSRF